MVRDPGLRCLQLLDQLPDLHLAPLRQEQEYREPGRVGEPVEEFGEKTHLLALTPHHDTRQGLRLNEVFLHELLLPRPHLLYTPSPPDVYATTLILLDGQTLYRLRQGAAPGSEAPAAEIAAAEIPTTEVAPIATAPVARREGCGVSHVHVVVVQGLEDQESGEPVAPEEAAPGVIELSFVVPELAALARAHPVPVGFCLLQTGLEFLEFLLPLAPAAVGLCRGGLELAGSPHDRPGRLCGR